MIERGNLACGCRYIQVSRAEWYQVVACPDHPMISRPLTEVPEDD
jgi:hypothetical protein